MYCVYIRMVLVEVVDELALFKPLIASIPATPCRLMLLDPRYLQADLLDELSKLNEMELPAIVAEHMGNVLKSVSRTECYATGNVDQDGVSLAHNHFIQTMTLRNIDMTLCNMVILCCF